MDLDADRLDGNALAGPLAEVFVAEVTAATFTCAACGRRGVMAELVVYAGGPGQVGRCPGCGAAVVRYTSTPQGRFLDLSGASVLRLPAQA